MKRFYTALSFLFIVTMSFAQTNVWTRKNDVGYVGTDPVQPATRANYAGFSIAGKAYYGMGYNFFPNTYYKDFWQYDTLTNTWTQKANFTGTARSGCVAFTIGGKGYIGLGRVGTFSSGSLIAPYTYYKDIYEYDPSTNIWTAKTSYAGASRIGQSAFVVGSKGYVACGTSSTGTYTKDLWEFDPTANTWLQKANLPDSSRTGAGGFSIGTKGYLAMGYVKTPTSQVLSSDLWEYDVSTNSWTKKADLPSDGRTNVAAAGIGTKGYIFNGTIFDGFGLSNTTECWEYNQGTNNWSQKNNFPNSSGNNPFAFTAGNNIYLGMDNSYYWEYIVSSDSWIYRTNNSRIGAVGFTIGTKGYVGTGSGPGGYKKDFWEYEATTGVWTQKADFGGDPRSGAFGFGLGTTGYLGTGTNNSGYLDDVWAYDQGLNTWSQKNAFTGGARAYPVSFVIGTKGYVATGTYLNDLWEYNEAGDIWVQKASLPANGRSWAAGFSVGTKGYIGTGYDDNTFAFFNDFWEYDQSTDTWTQKTDFPGSPRWQSIGFAANGAGYIGLGSSTSEMWKYDPVTNAWLQRASYPGTGQNSDIAFTLNNRVYVGTGDAAQDFWQYTPDPNSSLPVTFMSITAQKRSDGNLVDWKIANESGIKQYLVERADDGHTFRTAGIVESRQNSLSSNYQWLDRQPFGSKNYYRIKALELSGESRYSTIVVLTNGNALPTLNVAPNPVTRKVLNLQLNNFVAGSYKLRLTNTLGQQVYSTSLELTSGSISLPVQLPNSVAPGNYQLEILSAEGDRKTQRIIIAQ